MHTIVLHSQAYPLHLIPDPRAHAAPKLLCECCAAAAGGGAALSLQCWMAPRADILCGLHLKPVHCWRWAAA